ncbi:MAG: Hsp20/alpha crystallin family protein [Candidatus Heimdallarchaeota archaeon]|nr:Hsp20/alpha crystallin family protein [Candidatus Heimdallarchaeota archaeon]MDH5645293.1 Hsp20/alpha crystallin family protein [Candidatus Heimdallarchaeota archaeon]
MDNDELNIINGKFIDPTYKNDFHQFEDELKLICFLVLPGINAKSIEIKVEKQFLQIKATLDENGKLLLKKKMISLSGHLTCDVKDNIFTTRYENGILIINLIKCNNIT